MSKKKAQFHAKNITVRHYELGETEKILDFLNLCYGQWRTSQEWHARYVDHPTASKENVVLMEVDNKIVGHGGLIFRDLAVGKNKLRTASLSDAAIHPRYRRRGLYAKLVDIRLKAAKSRGAVLAFTWHVKGSDAYNHNKRIGFVEVKQSPVYMRIIKPAKVIKSGLFDLLQKNQSLKEALRKLGVDLCFRLDNSKFSVTEILGRVDKKPKKDQSRIEIVLDKNSLHVIANFRNMGRLKRIACLIMLVSLGRAKIKFGSFKTLLTLILKGVALIGSI
ncbi:MAG: GNAT family N-acetyltransferase [Candidatus Bathyarchaeia archaeon]